MMSEYRLAIVGCGAVAEIGHIPAACKLKNVKLVGLVDTDINRAEMLAERFGVPKAVSSLENVANGVDAVILATPPHVRPLLAEQAFSAGLHVLCEKPLANTSEQCRAMLTAAKRAKRVLAVAHTARFFSNRVRVHALLKEKFLGRLATVDVEQGDPYAWPSRTSYTVRRDMVAGGVLLNEGVHSLDTLLWWFGSPTDFEYEDDSLGGIESNVRMKIRFADSITCQFRLSRTCKLKNRIRLEGEAGALVLPLYDQAEIVITRGGRTTTEKLAQSNWDFVEIVSEQLQDFVHSIETERPPRVTGEDGLAVVEFVEKCYAAKRQRPLPKLTPLPGLTW
jgi:predicted dehydrogenase